MKIAFFTDHFLPDISGVSTSLYTIATALAKRGHAVTIFTPRPSRRKQMPVFTNNLVIEHVSSFPSLFYQNLRVGTPIAPRTIQKLRALNPDIIHVQTPYSLGITGVLLGRMFKKPVIGSFHGYFMEPEYLQILGIKGQATFLNSFLWKYATFFYNHCTIIHTPSSLTKSELQSRKVKKQIVVIPNTIDQTRIAFKDTQSIKKLKEKYMLKDSVALYVGRLSPEKNIDLLLRSFSKLVKKFPQVSLMIIGDGPSKKHLETFCKKEHIQNSVVFTGEIPHEKLLKDGFFQAATLFVTPSASELQPVSIIEAMYFSLPVVGVAKRGVSEMLEGVGVLAKPNSPRSLSQMLSLVLSDKSLQKMLAMQSQKEFRKKYTLPIVISHYEHMYQRLLLV